MTRPPVSLVATPMIFVYIFIYSKIVSTRPYVLAVLHRDLRNVVLCLLEVARVGAEYGLELPAILKLEKEFDMEEQQSDSSQITDDVDSKIKDKVKVKDQPRKKAKTPTPSKERIQTPKIAKQNEKYDQTDRLHKQVNVLLLRCLVRNL